MAKNVGTKTEDFLRPPVVTVMGHVDHGKTSILDAIKNTSVQKKEYGGITQHIGAYQIEHNSKKITFIDTPGHAAFSQMRSRGGKASDIVVLVVAANDSVMPQTKEAIAHARAAKVPIIVAINKIDLPGANPQKVKQDLAQENVLVEEWGGDVIAVNVSAVTKEGLDKLLDAIVAVSEILQLKANPNGDLEAIVIESRLDRQKGVVVSCIVKNGTLKIGHEVMASGFTAKIKSIMNDKGQMLQSAGPSTTIEILGFKEVPHVGDLVLDKGSELAELALCDAPMEIKGEHAKKTVAVILRADTSGTLEAVRASLADLIGSSVGSSYSLKFLHCSTGDVTESDVMLAQGAKGIILGFDVKMSPSVKDFADSQKVPVKIYKAIYELIDEAVDILEGTAFAEEKKIKGRAQVLQLFKLPSGDVVAGCKVLAGALKENSKVAIYDKDPSELTRDDIPLYRGLIKNLKKGKDDIQVAGKDTECGVLFKPEFEGISKGQWIETQ